MTQEHNLIFHYGLFTNALVEAGMVDRVRPVFYLTFYNAECLSVANRQQWEFILDVIATNAKIMIRIDELNWDLEVHDTLLKSFLLLDNPTGSERTVGFILHQLARFGFYMDSFALHGQGYDTSASHCQRHPAGSKSTR